jgi:hypothetical protein
MITVLVLASVVVLVVGVAALAARDVFRQTGAWSARHPD